MAECVTTEYFPERDKAYFESRCNNGCLLQAGVIQQYQYWDAPDGYGVKPGATVLKIRDNFDPSVNDGQGLFPECGYITLPGPDPECNDGTMTEYAQIDYVERNSTLGYTTVHFHKLSGINCDMTDYGGAQYYHRTNEMVIVGDPDNPYYDCDKCKDTSLIREEIRCIVNTPSDLANVEEPIHGERCLVRDSYANNCNYSRIFVYDCEYNSGKAGIEHWRPTNTICHFADDSELPSFAYENDITVVHQNTCPKCSYLTQYYNGSWHRVVCAQQKAVKAQGESGVTVSVKYAGSPDERYVENPRNFIDFETVAAPYPAPEGFKWQATVNFAMAHYASNGYRSSGAMTDNAWVRIGMRSQVNNPSHSSSTEKSCIDGNDREITHNYPYGSPLDGDLNMQGRWDLEGGTTVTPSVELEVHWGAKMENPPFELSQEAIATDLYMGASCYVVFDLVADCD